MFDNLTPEELNKAMSNPFYCLSEIAPIFTQEHEPLITEEKWIEANLKIIEQIGAKQWLTHLLENLKGEYV